MKKKKIALIIQGIMVANHGKIKNHSYDCNKNIKKLLDNFSHLFSEVVLATWESEKNKINIEILKNKKLKVLFLKDPGVPKLYSNDESDNRLRQFYSTHEGIKSLKDNVEVVIKIRTDLYLDLKKIIHFFLTEEKRKIRLLNSNFEGIICSKRYYLTHPYWLSDFFYIGNKNIMKEFFFSQIKYKRQRFALTKKRAPEADSIYKFLYFKRKKIKIFDEIKYFPFLPKRLYGSRWAFYKDEFDLWQFALRQYFSIIPYRITKSAIWKGLPYYKYYPQKVYGYKSFLEAEKNYVETLNKISKSLNTFVIYNYNFSLVNFNYIKRKLENKYKKNLFIINFFNFLNKFEFQLRKLLFFFRIKRH